jgi:hypothetical protein
MGCGSATAHGQHKMVYVFAGLTGQLFLKINTVCSDPILSATNRAISRIIATKNSLQIVGHKLGETLVVRI